MKSFRICIQDIRKWGSNNRIKMCLVMSVLFVYTYTQGLGTLAVYVGEEVNPWIYPFLFTFRYMKIMYLVLLISIFCDAPFVDNNQVYVMLRTKRTTWCIGQIMYIVAASVIFSIWLLISSVLINIGHMQWGKDWGQVLGAAGTTSALNVLGIKNSTVSVSSIVIRYYEPYQAMIITFLIMVLSFIVIGLTVYVFNVLTKTKIAGVLIAGFFVMFTAVVDDSPKLTWFSPMSWNSLDKIDVAGTTMYPTIGYVLIMYVVIIAVLSAAALLLCRRQEIIAEEEK